MLQHKSQLFWSKKFLRRLFKIANKFCRKVNGLRTDRQTDRRTGREGDEQTDRHMDEQIDRQTDRQLNDHTLSLV